MNSTFKAVLEDTILKATGGNRGKTTQAIESWSQNVYDENTDIIDEYEKQLARNSYIAKMQEIRHLHLY